jgi:hypothetical protein
MELFHASTPNAPDPDDILGQFFFAFGQGAGNMRVQRGAIAALRRRYRPAIEVARHEWDSAAPHVLGLIAQVGRLAAALATQSGRAAIAEADFMTARRLVEANAHRRAESDGRLIAGPFCPPVPGESAAGDSAPVEHRDDCYGDQAVLERPLQAH